MPLARLVRRSASPGRRVLQLGQAVRADLTSDDPPELLAGTGADRRMVAVVGRLDENSLRAGRTWHRKLRLTAGRRPRRNGPPSAVGCPSAMFPLTSGCRGAAG